VARGSARLLFVGLVGGCDVLVGGPQPEPPGDNGLPASMSPGFDSFGNPNGGGVVTGSGASGGSGGTGGSGGAGAAQATSNDSSEMAVSGDGGGLDAGADDDAG